VNVAFAIKAEVRGLPAKGFAFTAPKTMYGGKQHRHVAQAIAKKPRLA
jgi:hypothetical protein